MDSLKRVSSSPKKNIKKKQNKQKDKENECTTKSSKGKLNNVWKEYDEQLINAVRKYPCIWNHSLPVSERSPTKVAEAWILVASEFDGIVLHNFKYY